MITCATFAVISVLCPRALMRWRRLEQIDMVSMNVKSGCQTEPSHNARNPVCIIDRLHVDDIHSFLVLHASLVPLYVVDLLTCIAFTAITQHSTACNECEEAWRVVEPTWCKPTPPRLNIHFCLCAVLREYGNMEKLLASRAPLGFAYVNDDFHRSRVVSPRVHINYLHKSMMERIE